MGKNIKRLSLALIALGLSAPVFADSCCNPCNPFSVTIPNQQGGFTVGADALWLRPTAPNTTYNITVGDILASTAPTSLTIPLEFQHIDPSYHLGFDLNAAYRIACTGNDVSVNWTHLGETSDSETTPTLFIPGGREDDDFDLHAHNNVKFKLDSVDLDVGQRVNLGNNFLMRLFAGVRFADLQEKKNTDYHADGVDIGPVDTVHVILDQDSEFKGVGPQVGVDGRYCIGSGFGVDANITGSLLVGRTDSNSDILVTALRLRASQQVVFAADLPIDQKRKNRVVPALDASLGLDYTYNFNNCYRSSLVIQAGYKAIHYFDANTLHISDGPNGASNIGFDGPYAGVKVNF